MTKTEVARRIREKTEQGKLEWFVVSHGSFKSETYRTRTLRSPFESMRFEIDPIDRSLLVGTVTAMEELVFDEEDEFVALVDVVRAKCETELAAAFASALAALERL